MQDFKYLIEQLNDFEKLSSELLQIKKELSIIRSSPPIPVMVTEKEISAELNISTKTLRKYRQQHILPFVRLGKRIFYDRYEMMNRLREANKSDPSIRISSKLSRMKKRLF